MRSTTVAVQSHAPAGAVDDQPPAGALQHVGLRLVLGAGAPQQRPHPRRELAGAERLGDVVVGAELQPPHEILLGVPGGQHDDRHVGLGAQPPAHVLAGHAGKAEVEDDEIRPAARGGGERLFAARRPVHRVALSLEVALHDFGDAGLVFDDEDAGGSGHESIIPAVPGPGSLGSRPSCRARPGLVVRAI